tara:strand:+ start:105 stop:1028 length:924 start_codon:yes stop_codon:yes gene_type:complete
MIATKLNRRNFIRVAVAGISTACLPGIVGLLEPIIKRAIPKTGEMLPIVGLGTWRAFDISGDPSVWITQREVLRMLLDAGANVIDTSPMHGRAEIVIGELLNELEARDATFLAAKVWAEGKDRGIAQMEESLRRLRTNRIDLMQIHNLVDWHTQLETLQLWKAAGIFRYIGVTHYTSSAIDRLVHVMERGEVDFVQIAYSIGERAVEDKLLPVAAERGIAVIVNRPYEGGQLFNSVRGEDVPEWAIETGCKTWGQFFLKFVLSHPIVTCAIPATSNPGHMMENLWSARGTLPDEKTRQRMVQYWEDV